MDPVPDIEVLPEAGTFSLAQVAALEATLTPTAAPPCPGPAAVGLDGTVRCGTCQGVPSWHLVGAVACDGEAPRLPAGEDVGSLSEALAAAVVSGSLPEDVAVTAIQLVTFAVQARSQVASWQAVP